MGFQEQLNALRKRQGLSQEELANIVGVSRQAVQKWESGAAWPDIDNLIALSRFFEISLDELVGLEKAPAGTVSGAANSYYTAQPPESGAATYYIPCRWHYEYKSRRSLFGLPLVHIHFADRGLARASGVLAIGNTATGLISIGGASLGLISLGGLSLGLFSLGGLALGLMAVGGLALGAAAVGGCALGTMVAYGGLAVGNAAIGGCAVGNVAIGSKAIGKLAFSLGDNASVSPEIWAQFCRGVRDMGFGYQVAASILLWLGPK